MEKIEIGYLYNFKKKKEKKNLNKMFDRKYEYY